MFNTLKSDVNENKGIATITIMREEKRNALSPATMLELGDALMTCDNNPGVKVMVITGAGTKAFSAGADFGESSSASSDSLSRYEGVRGLADLLKVISNLNKPLVGRINGHALGGGLGLAVACDILIAAEDCRFGTPEINVGLFPFMIMAPLLRHVTSRKKLLEMALTGERWDAKTAMEMGLLNHVVPRDQLDNKVNEVVEKLIEKAPRITRIGKKYFYRVLSMDYEQILDYGASMLASTVGSEEVTEGVTAFMEKRKPVWKSK